MISILTNSLIPCNGRFPTLLALLGLFVCTAENAFTQPVFSALLLSGLLLLSVSVTFACSSLLSHTLLKGLPSSFTLELPPFRKPKVCTILVRSLLDRTLFVLGRAVSVAAPAGALVWLLAHVQLHGVSLLQQVSNTLDPFGRLLGMDGVILLAFILGFPANEIVLPLMLMIYTNQSELIQIESLYSLKSVLVDNGWTIWTAASVLIFTLFHWPCSTTILTVFKETKCIKWTTVAVLLPTLTGFFLAFLLHCLSTIFP